MKILALDTALSMCSVGLWQAGQYAGRSVPMERGHAESLMPMMEAVLGEAHVGYGELDLITVTVGPGAFTGLRAGLAAARGLALALDRPCVGVTTLEAVAQAVYGQGPGRRALLVAHESRRAELYVQFFGEDGCPVSEPAAVLPRDLVGLMTGRTITVAGTAAEAAAAALRSGGIEVGLASVPGHPLPEVIAAIGERRWRVGAPLTPPSPLYLRPPDTGPCAGGGR
jgi:tRNA threonylcarbamoyladenosine biosynthesis protein TsaB